MKKGMKKTISVIAILTMTFQMIMPMVPGLTSKVFATNTTIPVTAEKLQATVGEEAVTELSESTDTTETEKISRNYEIKEEETWDISVNGDGSVIAKWTLDDRTLTISGTGEMKDWESGSIEDWHYTQYDDLIEKVIINAEITNIGNSAFIGCSSLISITIPKGVIYIGSDAFRGCSSLESIDIPEGVTSIEDDVFYGCSSLKNIIIPEGVTSIGNGAFSGCSSLENINIPGSVTYIFNYDFVEDVFSRCSSLKNINVSTENKNYTSENGILFNKEKTEIICYPAGKKDIKEYTIPSTVTSIGWNAFSGCSSLVSISIPEGVTSIRENAFSGCSNLESINIPEGVTNIEDDAFNGCSSLKSIEIPDSVTSIGRNAFGGCGKLIMYVKSDSIAHQYAEENKKAYILDKEASNITTDYQIKEEETWDVSINQDGSVIAKWILSNRTLTISGIGEMKDWDFYLEEDWHSTKYTNAIEKVIIIEGITNIGEYAFEECSSLESITIPEGVTSIGSNVFDGCSSLTNIIIPEGVTNIEMNAFKECSSLESIEIPTSITSIGNYAFYGCSSLTNIAIPEEVRSIGEDAFERCSSLIEINIPESVTYIEYNPFSGCSSLENINVSTENRNYTSENGILFNKEKIEIICYPAGKKDIKEYTIPSTVTSIKYGAFEDCNSLVSITIPEGVTSIGSNAFRECSGLEDINIPEKVTNIENYTFSGCSSLESIENPKSITSIGDHAFYGCSGLTSINIPEGVTSIEDSTFSGCSSLTNIEIPEEVTSIGEDAFVECSSLTSIEIPEEATSIGGYAFYECSSLKNVTVPEGVTSIGSNAIPESTIIYTKSNSEGHRYAEEEKQGYIIDDIAPTVTFTPNAGENIQKQYSVTVEVQDDMEEVGVNENSLKYQWTQSEQQPTKESFTESFENGQAIIKNTGDGAWYLWIYAEDNVGNETITRSEAFHFDNTAPNVNVEYSTKNPTKENVTVTITSNEEVQAIQGWRLSSDKKTLTREYTKNTTETITIKDLAGNETKVDIEINNIIIIGDINQDGRIDITDFLMLKRHLVAGNKTDWILTGSSLEAADMNENGTVDITDMLMLKRVVVENM